MNHEKLTTCGFRPGLMMHWMEGPGSFKITPMSGDAEVMRIRSVIYAWYDRHSDVVMNVGETGQSLQARFLNQYSRWLNLNGRIADGPMRRRWLDHIKTSKSGLIEVHIHACDPSMRKQEETRFINQLHPKLNVRRRPVVVGPHPAAVTPEVGPVAAVTV